MSKLNNKKMHEFIANEQYDWLNTYVKDAVKKNQSEGYYWLGKIYQHGFGKEKDISKAIECYQKASDMYCGDATIHLALFYYKGIGVDKDEHKAYELAQLAAHQNNAYGQFITGIRYGNYFDNTIEKDLNKAVFYLNLAYKNGLQIAKKIMKSFICQVALRKTQFDGLDINDAIYYCENETFGNQCDITLIFNEVDEYALYEQAREYYEIRKAARRGVVKAMYDLGYYYENTKNYKKAIIQYQKCLKHNYTKAYLGLSICYDHINLNKAIHYYELAKKYNHTNSDEKYKNKYYMIDKGKELINENIDLATEYFTHAIDLGSIESYYELGICSYYKKENEKAFDYFLKATKVNHAFAQLKVAYCYFYGIGIDKDIEKAKEYLDLFVKNNWINNCDKNRMIQLRSFLEEINCQTAKYILAYTYEWDTDYHKEYVGFEEALKILYELSNENYLDSKEVYQRIYEQNKETINIRNNYRLQQVKQLLEESMKCGDLLSNDLYNHLKNANK